MYDNTRLKPFFRRHCLWIMLIPLLALSGCMVGPNYQAPESEKAVEIEVPEYPEIFYSHADFSRWWDIFNDPTLTSLIDRAEQGNLDLKIAIARIKEARAAAGIVSAELFPSVDADGSVDWRKESENVNPLATSNQTEYTLSADAGWEIDLFGRIRRSMEAATADFQVSREDFNNVLITIRAEVAGTYLQLRTFQAQQETTLKNIQAQKSMLNLTMVRFENGLASKLDVAQAGRILANTKSELPVIRTGLAQTITSLSVLLGEPSGKLRIELQTADPVPLPPAEVTVGIPAESIRQRPDIRRAERQLAAQTARIGVATADLYPSFSLTGYLGISSLSTGSLFDSDSQIYGIGPTLRWNIFDMGRVRNQIAVEDARTEQALHNYELTMLQAIKEVEDRLNGYHEQRIRMAALAESVKASQEALKMSTKLYKDGLSGFQDVLDAQRSLLAAESNLDATRGDISIQLVGLYKALAGGWNPGQLQTNR